jgi:tetratricopeptide (TPR) repeat protein
MRILLILFSINFSFNLIAQETKWDLWQKKYEGQKNYFPEYGRQAKTKEEIKADDSFIETVTKLGYSRKEGSNQMASKGWNFLRQGDFGSAMKRFNQAWLLDSTNSNALWGFGTILGIFENTEGSLKYLELAYKNDNTSKRLLVDIATSYVVKYNLYKDLTDINKAIEKLTMYLSIDPKNEEALYKMALCCFHLGDFKGSWDYIHKCQINGGRPIEKSFLKALKDKMKEPKK